MTTARRRAFKKEHTRKNHGHRTRYERTSADGSVTPCAVCRPSSPTEPGEPRLPHAPMSGVLRWAKQAGTS